MIKFVHLNQRQHALSPNLIYILWNNYWTHLNMHKFYIIYIFKCPLASKECRVLRTENFFDHPYQVMSEEGKMIKLAKFVKKHDFIYGANRKLLLWGAIVQIIIKIQLQSYNTWENHAKFSVRNTLKCIFHADYNFEAIFFGMPYYNKFIYSL